MQKAAAQTGAIAAPVGAGLRQMAKRVGARVAEGARVRRAAAAERVEDDEKRARFQLATVPLVSAATLKAAANKARV